MQLAEIVRARLVELLLRNNPIGDDGINTLARAIKGSILLDRFGVDTYDCCELARREMIKSFLLSRAPLGDCSLGYNLLGDKAFFFKVLAVCTIEDVSAVRNRVSGAKFQRNKRSAYVISTIDKWVEQKVLIRRAFVAYKKDVVKDVVNIICLYLFAVDWSDP